MSSGVKVWEPSSSVSPMTRSSKKGLAETGGIPRPDAAAGTRLRGGVENAAALARNGLGFPGGEHHPVRLAQHLLVGLVDHVEMEAHEAEGGPALGNSAVQDRHMRAQGVAGPDGLDPLHLLDSRRAHGGGIEKQPVGDETHVEAAGVPAGGDQRADEAVPGGDLVHMEGLGVIFPREGHDVVLRDRKRPEGLGQAGRKIFERAHGHPLIGACPSTTGLPLGDPSRYSRFVFRAAPGGPSVRARTSLC